MGLLIFGAVVLIGAIAVIVVMVTGAGPARGLGGAHRARPFRSLHT